MGLSETLLELSNQIARRAKENKENKEKGMPNPYNDMLDAINHYLDELGEIFGKKSILLPPKKLRDIKPKDRRSKRQKRLDAKNKRL